MERSGVHARVRACVRACVCVLGGGVGCIHAWVRARVCI